MKPTLGWWHDKKVLVTGHTGFKGAWLTMWLHRLGAIVHGVSLRPTDTNNLFFAANVSTMCKSTYSDINDISQLNQIIGSFDPDVCFHLAAQPLVRESYVRPFETFSTNVMGTVSLLESFRSASNPCSIVIITTDKVYKNNDRGSPFREVDPLGSADPYSSSKAAAELVVDSYRTSFFDSVPDIQISSARAGNVIGGGDWSADRLIPDCFRAVVDQVPVIVRNPSFTRPWQHVLDPLMGYMKLAELQTKKVDIQGAYNFGPSDDVGRSVDAVLKLIGEEEPSLMLDYDNLVGETYKEASTLALDTLRAQTTLGFQPVWRFEDAVLRSARWYKSFIAGANAEDLCLQDIADYEMSL